MRKFVSRLVRSVQFGAWHQPVAAPFGTRLYGHPLDGTFQMILRNAYGDFTYSSLREASADCAFLDIGANIGFYSVALGGHFTGARFALEPNPFTFSYLQRNLKLAGLADVNAVCAGLSEGNAMSATLNTRPFHSGAASLRTDFGHRRQRISLLPPPMLQAMLPPHQRIVCKIDVEGAELGVVRGLHAAGVLQRCDRLVIEMSDGTNDAGSLGTIRSILVSAGLSLRSRSGSSHFGDELFTRDV